MSPDFKPLLKISPISNKICLKSVSSPISKNNLTDFKQSDIRKASCFAACSDQVALSPSLGSELGRVKHGESTDVTLDLGRGFRAAGFRV